MNLPSKSTVSPLSRLVQFTLLLASANLYAQQPMLISLNGDAEGLPLITTASGTGQIAAMPDRTVSGSIKVAGPVPTVAHIHEGAVGKNGPPVMTPTQIARDSVVVPAGARQTDAQYTGFASGKLYLSVHSTRHPNGEVRAQSLRTEAAATPTRAAIDPDSRERS